jgi:AbrB family looped-hinge helix DNA binding protein
MFKDIKFYGAATVGTKGQIVIPAEAREELEIKEGDKLIILRAHEGSGLAILKGEMLEEMVGQMQSHLGSIVDSMKNAKTNAKETN